MPCIENQNSYNHNPRRPKNSNSVVQKIDSKSKESRIHNKQHEIFLHCTLQHQMSNTKFTNLRHTISEHVLHCKPTLDSTANTNTNIVSIVTSRFRYETKRKKSKVAQSKPTEAKKQRT